MIGLLAQKIKFNINKSIWPAKISKTFEDQRNFAVETASIGEDIQKI